MHLSTISKACRSNSAKDYALLMTTNAELIREGATVLADAGVGSPEPDSATLLAFVLGAERSDILPFTEVQPEVARKFNELITRRATREPLQHITGVAHFRYLTLHVGPGVFVPRPETELLGDAAISYLKNRGATQNIVVELCAGSGALALAIATEVPGTEVHAVELSPEAHVWLTRNIAAHVDHLKSAGSSVTAYLGDAGDTAILEFLNGRVDAVVTNPPYIPQDMIPRDPEARDHDPSLALFGGHDGLDVARRVARVASALLKPGGFVGMEHADVQGESVPAMFAEEEAAWIELVDNKDYNQLPRFTTGIRAKGGVQ